MSLNATSFNRRTHHCQKQEKLTVPNFRNGSTIQYQSQKTHEFGKKIIQINKT